MARVCRIVVVVEGWEDRAFAEGFLASAGVAPRSIDAKVSPKGHGSGFSFVREVFAQELGELARYREGRGVLALMDEDGKGIDSRRGWVADYLRETERLPIDCAEGRCLILPKRNLETWVYWLTGSKIGQNWAVDEGEDYKTARPASATRSLDNSDWRAAGQHLHTFNHTLPPQGMPGELAASLVRLREFVNAVRR
jgi:hypothetical protein